MVVVYVVKHQQIGPFVKASFDVQVAVAFFYGLVARITCMETSACCRATLDAPRNILCKFDTVPYSSSLLLFSLYDFENSVRASVRKRWKRRNPKTKTKIHKSKWKWDMEMEL